MTRTLLKGAAILSMDPSVGDHRRGDVLVDNGVLAHVGPPIEAVDCEIVDASDAIVMPGLIDAHRHLWYAGIRGDDMNATIFDLYTGSWGKLAAAFTPEDVYAFTRAGIANALDSGITTLFDWCHVINTPEHAEAAVQAHQEMRMRAVFGYGESMTQKLSPVLSDAESWRHATQLRERHFASDDARLTMALALPGLDLSTPETTRTDIAAARAMNVPMSFHLGVPMGPPPNLSIKRLVEYGLLGSDMSFAHCCNTTAEEFRMLADHGGHAISCPSCDASLNLGASPSRRMRENGLAPCFGADAVSAGSGDLFEEARLGLCIERSDYGLDRFARGEAVVAHGDRITTRQALEAVTSVAAHSCWLGDRVGTLTPGKRADLILLRASDSNLWPASNLLDTVVSSAHCGNVDAVMIDGDFVKRDGSLVGVDTAAIRADLVHARDRLYAAADYDGIEPTLARLGSQPSGH
ncbi:amidohydrolase family protein [Nocardia sp. ET3-3]|uniref:Amidohydrolase family protein n=1 Tax=Nocardia terrae TaxID=2675851 RepID=A0A7K1US84_9NOCA|nr:amidohydrolase family protein [Nocardia terrae]MVU77194.1 amidohydrolase family protein [Nocardia terrae]